MGAGQSAPTRKLSIPNEDTQSQSHFIKVSESVAERLKKCAEQNPIKPTEDCTPTTEEQKIVRNLENIPPQNRGLPGDPILNYYYGPSLTSIRVLQEKEQELKVSEDYWTRRIQNMEEHHGKLSKVMEDEYNKAVNEISCQVPRPPPNMPFPCSSEKDNVLNCYKRNPNEILLCAGEVMEFSDCVHAKRLKAEKLQGCEN